MLYLLNAAYLNRETLEIHTGNLAVEEGPFGGLQWDVPAPTPEQLHTTDRIIDCKGRLVTGALACGHHHIYSALSRGMPPAPKPPQNFNDVLKYIWWRLDKCLDADMIAASASVAALHMLKHGVTFCIDHHASPFAVTGSLSTIAEAFDKVGIGHLLCYEISCRDGEDIAQKGLEEHDRYLSQGGKGHVGLHASFTVSKSVLQEAVALAQRHNTGIHIHVAEAQSDMEHCLAMYGKTVVQRLQHAGVLDLPHTILGHCIHITEEDKEILASSPCWIVQNVESNQNNNVGLAGYGYHNNVMLGTDGMHSDMLRSAQAAYFSGISVEGLSCAEAYARLRRVHKHIALHNAPGDSANNLIILNYDSPTPMSSNNILGHIFYGWEASHVDTVISQGRVMVENGRYLGDEEGILAFAREQAQRLWSLL